MTIRNTRRRLAKYRQCIMFNQCMVLTLFRLRFHRYRQAKTQAMSHRHRRRHGHGSSDRHLQKDDQVDIDNEAYLQYYYFLHEEEEVQQWWSKLADANIDSRETRIERERECRWNEQVDAVCSNVQSRSKSRNSPSSS